MWKSNVIPAKAGIHRLPGEMDFPKPSSMDSRFRGNDGYGTALRLRRDCPEADAKAIDMRAIDMDEQDRQDRSYAVEAKIIYNCYKSL